MDQQSTTAAQDRHAEQKDSAGGESSSGPGAEPENTRGTDDPAGTEAPHEEEKWESEGGNPA
jgi:hypothetical protein